MTKLEDLTVGARLTGLVGRSVVSIESVAMIGDQAAKLIFRNGAGQLGERLVYRDDEQSLSIVKAGRPWSFDGDGELLRLVSEA